VCCYSSTSKDEHRTRRAGVASLGRLRALPELNDLPTKEPSGAMMKSSLSGTKARHPRHQPIQSRGCLRSGCPPRTLRLDLVGRSGRRRELACLRFAKSARPAWCSSGVGMTRVASENFAGLILVHVARRWLTTPRSAAGGHYRPHEVARFPAGPLQRVVRRQNCFSRLSHHEFTELARELKAESVRDMSSGTRFQYGGTMVPESIPFCRVGFAGANPGSFSVRFEPSRRVRS